MRKLLFGRTERDCSIETGLYSLNIFHFLSFSSCASLILIFMWFLSSYTTCLEVLFSHFTFVFIFFPRPVWPRIPFLWFEFCYFSLISFGFVTARVARGLHFATPPVHRPGGSIGLVVSAPPPSGVRPHSFPGLGPVSRLPNSTRPGQGKINKTPHHRQVCGLGWGMRLGARVFTAPHSEHYISWLRLHTSYTFPEHIIWIQTSTFDWANLFFLPTLVDVGFFLLTPPWCLWWIVECMTLSWDSRMQLQFRQLQFRLS